MRLIWKAVRAVAVETLGVIAVVWLLFAGAGMTMQDRGSQHAVDAGRALDWAEGKAADLVDALKPNLAPHDRERYVEERLGHYGEMYREAAGDYIERTAKELAREVNAEGVKDDSAVVIDLFGSL
ncbi:MAG: hypothetical protein CMJ64_26975 [Planctomycetaceae bacterium]|nr:hypothetical protein [Planctomycetaceae bacterium]|tara:strand:+ start:408 stop:782 length:375 start_codon:yes stop_codon:yes gene_type:complete